MDEEDDVNALWEKCYHPVHLNIYKAPSCYLSTSYHSSAQALSMGFPYNSSVGIPHPPYPCHIPTLLIRHKIICQCILLLALIPTKLRIQKFIHICTSVL